MSPGVLRRALTAHSEHCTYRNLYPRNTQSNSHPHYPPQFPTMSTSPSPEDRKKKDEEDRAREKEEQAKLPYKWTQTIQDLDITVAVPSNLRGKDMNVVMTKTHLKVGVKGQEPVIDVRQLPLTIPLPLPLHISPSNPFPTGPPPPRNSLLRINLDARNPTQQQRNLPPPRQIEQTPMVVGHHNQRPLPPRHLENPTREQQAGGSGRGDAGHGGENDV